ncbi:carbamoyltransferase [Acidobacteria bacterium ACD]|nr:MAG: carbamoyltransferase [Acidobacteriota bacterium]MCE7956341.1 carbamoyltransferase [Acidobacteria bacterium ACB2]MDL1948649.1 carbamoyltransferase [Acidobacteria bacterium ACD]
MSILGINAFHADSAACLVVDGRLVAAAEEERFRRLKHWAGFPSRAVEFCLQRGGLSLAEVDHVAVNRDPSANLLQKVLFSLSKRPSLAAIRDRLANAGKVRDVGSLLSEGLGDGGKPRFRVHSVEHHRAHLASSYFVSPFDEAAVVSVDGFGDFVSGMWGTGRGREIEVVDEVAFPHSLGLFYLAITQYLGFPHYGDEYKVMGLAPYGEPEMLEEMRKIVRLAPHGRYELDLDCFLHTSEGISMVWDDGEPRIAPVYSEELTRRLGPPRGSDEPIADRHKALAASMQAMYEEAFFHVLAEAGKRAGTRNLALAGGCAMNSVANGKVFERSGFREMYVQSAAGDAGGAIGAAYYVWNQVLGMRRGFVMEHAYLGPEFTPLEVAACLAARAGELEQAGCVVERIGDEAELCRRTAERVADGAVVGWFQGRMEWGPRALGNRSIVCDPRRADMKEILNRKIKRRESFRPFAPSIVREAVADWFETDYEVPFMLQVYQIRPERRAAIPAVTHVNGSGRLQTVTEEQNPRYYRLIRAFDGLTGVPVVLNTSFNENEPVVCRPEEALDCFLRTKMDVLVLGETLVERR